LNILQKSTVYYSFLPADLPQKQTGRLNTSRPVLYAVLPPGALPAASAAAAEAAASAASAATAAETAKAAAAATTAAEAAETAAAA
jgi:hypothetical protein